ncbi:MAG: DUF2953 domain-containing protein [Lachnospiraceae bacterium]|nr:DUF2953 domain-containing protein [Lachnospiraceae bacterium]
MISIILTVFKIIGFLLLALLILLLLVVLAALFVPLRYYARLTHVEEETSGELRLTWMLHLISVRISLDMKDKKPDMQLRVLGISPADVKKLFRKRKKKRKQKRNRNGNQRPDSNAASGHKPDTSTAASQKPYDRSRKAQNGDGKTDSIEKKSDVKGKKNHSEAEADVAPGSAGSARRAQLLQKISTFGHKVRQIPHKVEQFIRKIRLFLKKPADFLKKLESLWKTAQKNEFSELCEELWNMLKALLKHYRVRNGSGYLQFGTGDASVTGELTGMLYLLLPATCGDIQIQPQFTDEIFRMDVQVRGHIRLIHLVRVAWSVFRNKRLRGLLRDLRIQA